MLVKYFLNRDGIETRRISGTPGSGHIESALTAEELDPNSDVYGQMFKLGYVRVVESEGKIDVDSPAARTKAQKAFIEGKRLKEHKVVSFNDPQMIEART